MIGESLLKCDPRGPLVIQIAKLYSTVDGLRFDAFGRILSGTVQSGQRVRVLGESYTAEDEEDMTIQEISSVSIYSSRYRIDVPSLSAGNWVLLGGVDESIFKTATIVDLKFPTGEDAFIFRPLRFPVTPVLKVAVEPLNPTELPKMMDGLRKINKSYPIVSTKVRFIPLTSLFKLCRLRNLANTSLLERVKCLLTASCTTCASCLPRLKFAFRIQS
jgi:U5 small nuclear ribonucleoprotein component